MSKLGLEGKVYAIEEIKDIKYQSVRSIVYRKPRMSYRVFRDRGREEKVAGR